MTLLCILLHWQHIISTSFSVLHILFVKKWNERKRQSFSLLDALNISRNPLCTVVMWFIAVLYNSFWLCKILYIIHYITNKSKLFFHHHFFRWLDSTDVVIGKWIHFYFIGRRKRIKIKFSYQMCVNCTEKDYHESRSHKWGYFLSGNKIENLKSIPWSIDIGFANLKN